MAHPTDPLQALQPLGFGPAFQKQMCALLEAARIFNDWEWRDIEGLAAHLRAFQAPVGATLFREGDPGDHLCLVIAGRIDIVKEDRKGERKVVASFGTGKTLGEMAIVDGEPRSATAVVAQTGTIAILTRTDFARLVAERPPLAIKLVLKVAKILSQRLRQTTGVLVDHIGA